jgi:thioredoxin-like negative regulator of GroEL
MKHVIYFSAPWCAPCTTFGPQFTAVMSERQDVTFEKVNIDADIEKARMHGVRAIPCIVVLNDGKEIARMHGAQVTKVKLEQVLQ